MNCYSECNFIVKTVLNLFISFDVQCIGRIKRADMKIVLYHIIRVSVESIKTALFSSITTPNNVRPAFSPPLQTVKVECSATSNTFKE